MWKWRHNIFFSYIVCISDNTYYDYFFKTVGKLLELLTVYIFISIKIFLGFHSLLPAKYEFYKHHLGVWIIIWGVLDIYVRKGQMDVDHQKLPIQT